MPQPEIKIENGPAFGQAEYEQETPRFPFLEELKTVGLKEADVGGKLWVLGELAALFPEDVPPCFVVPISDTQAEYYHLGRPSEGVSEALWERTLTSLKGLERRTGKKLGDPQDPLIVAVRGSYLVQLPGMMLTLLNVGLTKDTVKGLAELTKDEQFAWETYATLVYRFGAEVFHPDRKEYAGFYEVTPEDLARMNVAELQTQVGTYKQIMKRAGFEFPEDPYEQLRLGMKANLDSWYAEKARVGMQALGYRADSPEIALGIQVQVFGNMAKDSGTGVALTRDIDDGEKVLSGEWLPDAQGEELVSGERTGKPIEEFAKSLPEAYARLEAICEIAEHHYRDVQDLEFTVEGGKLWLLQSRISQRTAEAAVRVAVDMVEEGLILPEEALMRFSTEEMERLFFPRIEPESRQLAVWHGRLLGEAIPAGSGARVGYVVFDNETARRCAEECKDVILIRPETNPSDVPGMEAAVGMLTQSGGSTSHAALFARARGKAGVVGFEAMRVDLKVPCADIIRDTRTIATLREGDQITINGSTGEVFAGKVDLIYPKGLTPELARFLEMADEYSQLGVWANADNPEDADDARKLGAQGIGLCRTEHMFFDQEGEPISRREMVVKMIMAQTKEERSQLLEQLLPYQRQDFAGIFRVMGDKPVIIRLIDPPMHEFLPNLEDLTTEVGHLRTQLPRKVEINVIVDGGAQYIYQLGPDSQVTDPIQRELDEKMELLQVVKSLKETNPMMGLRGCRTGIVHPEVTEMQVRAIFEAACDVINEGLTVRPEVMIPLISDARELELERKHLERVAGEVMARRGIEVDYKFGTMIEIPRAAITADDIAGIADFFSFGTNDLTQMTYGLSRDDAEGKFLPGYIARGIYPSNPFQVLDKKGVGFLMQLAVEKGRSVNPDLEIGICGEHGGEPSSIEFCHLLGLNYVSCSPRRVPIARLAAAQAKIENDENLEIVPSAYANGLTVRKKRKQE